MDQAEHIINGEFDKVLEEIIDSLSKPKEEDKRDRQLGRPDNYDRRLWREREKLGYR